LTNFKFKNVINTGSITKVSALISVSDAKSLVTLSNFDISDSTFYYGKAIEIKAA
jgi:hypothetical protein